MKRIINKASSKARKRAEGLYYDRRTTMDCVSNRGYMDSNERSSAPSMTLTDTHNRRRNIAYVSRWSQQNDYPMIIWPEDTELLRLSDLPQIDGRPNKPPTWTDMQIDGIRPVQDTKHLREIITVGKAYFLDGRGNIVQCSIKTR